MTRLLTFGLVGSGLMLATPASAQICDGSASFRRSPVQLTASGGFNSNGHVLGGGLEFGGSRAFVGVGAGRSTYKLGGSSNEVEVDGGFQFALNPKHTGEICPLLSWGHSAGPHDFDAFNNGVIYDLDRNSITIGVGIGGVVVLSNHVQFLPSGSLSMLNVKSKLHNQNLGSTRNTTDASSLIQLGFGFLFNDALTARPSIVFVTGVSDQTTTFGLDLTVNLGRRAEH